MQYNYKVNGVSIAPPTLCTIKKGAMQNGRRDIKGVGNFKHVRKIRTVKMNYDFILDSDAIAVVANTWDKLDDSSPNMSFQFSYTDLGGIEQVFTAYFSDIEYSKSAKTRTTDYWENLNMEFIIF
jgi:hypothetical protein